MEIKNGDFVEIEFDIYANEKLVQTTDEKKAKAEKIASENFGPQTIILGKSFILKALDEDIIAKKSTEKQILVLSPENAYGIRKKEMIRVLPASAFKEHKTRPVVGAVYDFNGMYGTVKSIVGGRIMVDFNNPLANKEIKIEYKLVSKIDEIDKKVTVVMKNILKIPQNMFKIVSKDKELIFELPDQLVPIKDMLIKTIEEFVSEIKDYSVKIEKFKNQ